MNKNLNISLAQLNPVVGDLEYNKNKIFDAWGKAPENTDLVVFSELVVCGYPPEDLILKPFFIKHIHRAVQEIAAKSKSFKSAALIGSPWKDGDKTYNAVHLIYDGEIVETRYKHLLPNYDVFDEERVFDPGPLPAPVPFRDFSLGVMICEDMWTPAVSKHLAQKHADILIAINGSPFDIENVSERHDHASARVKETGLPLAYVNQVGGQDELVFDGGSFIMSPEGKPILQGHAFQEGLYNAALSQNGENWMITAEDDHEQTQLPERLYQALVLGLRDYIEKNNFPGVLIGLSGGIDSALSAAVAVDALGAERVSGVLMPSRFTSGESTEDAKALAENLGIEIQTVPIEDTVQILTETLQPALPQNTPPVTYENMQTRIRGMILMALSNANGKMVLTTGNKSEMAVGYATLYGDMCGGFNVLKDLYKTQVYALSNWRNEKSAVIPERTITKAPSAELREDQTDQDTLPAYETLDDILTCLIEKDMGLDEITARGHDAQVVSDVWRMLDRAEYKRRQAPPGVKISARAFGRDRRYPITNHFVNIIEKKGA